MRFAFLLFACVLVGAGCTVPEIPSVPEPVEESVNVPDEVDPSPVQTPEPEGDVLLPLDGTAASWSPTYRRFGEYFDDGRFVGYHVAEDSEIPAEDLAPGEVQNIPIRAIADGTVSFISWVAGYGGVMIVQHPIDGRIVSAIYGHIDLSSTALKSADRVTKGQFLANLGAHKSEETDGAREHLHFGLYEGTEMQIKGYETNPEDIANWINPYDFFVEHEAIVPDPDAWISSYDVYFPSEPHRDTGVFREKYGELEFSMPADWDVEWVGSLEALNLYSVSGEGTARERSQIFIRYFDASDFLTLNTVDIISDEGLFVGQEDYLAKRYVIRKKEGIPDFVDQPSWRNEEHTVTDFRAEEGFTRYYVVAANPDLDPAVYEAVLESMNILE